MTSDQARAPWAAAGVTLDELWDGEMQGVAIGDADVLLVHVDGCVRAFDDKCPHAATLLSEGTLVGGVVTCRAHLWQFDAVTGKGINPDDCAMTEYRVKIVDGGIYVKFEP